MNTNTLLITSSNALGEEGGVKGGVQVCTLEYLSVFRAAGLKVFPVTSTPDRRFPSRVRRRLHPKPYRAQYLPSLSDRIIQEAQRTGARVIFINTIDLASVAGEVRERLDPEVKIVLLSHGLHSTDLLHSITAGQESVRPSSRDLRWLGGHLTAEREQRKYLDHVFCLSELDVWLERWIGARSASWLPRIVEAQPLAWRPVAGRLGFVGTLDHPPNGEGLHLFLRAMQLLAEGMRLRIVGAPVQVGRELAVTYSMVDYLGPLDDRQLLQEAETWTCTIHPMFCYGGGCNTKLATYLAWQIPMITTPQGCRGYVWKEGRIPQADTPEGLARLALAMNDPAAAAAARADLVKVAATGPTVHDVARTVLATLETIGLSSLGVC